MINLNHSHKKIINILFFLGILFLLSCNYINQDNVSDKNIHLDEVSFPKKQSTETLSIFQTLKKKTFY
tara:strand:- start:422 stop:625 length:204 start_codon:yes stop_codon:yes gene_type:complete